MTPTIQEVLYALNDLTIDMRMESRPQAAERLERATAIVEKFEDLRKLAERVADIDANVPINKDRIASLVLDAMLALGRK